MRQIKNLKNQTSEVGSSPENCMSYDEYQRLCDSGELTHGVYVCGMGYALPPVVIYGSASGNGCGCGCGHGCGCGCGCGEDEGCGCGCGCGWDWNANPDYGCGCGSGNGDSDSNQGGGAGSTGTDGSSFGNNTDDGDNANTGDVNGSSQPDTGVDDILSPSDFQGYKKSDPYGCLNRCKEMLAIADCTLDGGEIAMTKYDGNGRATNPTSNVSKGLKYINNQLGQGHPVIVSVDYKPGTSMGAGRDDQAGDHFVIIVGGSDKAGYHYYDPNTASIGKGTSEDNLLVVGSDKIIRSILRYQFKIDGQVMSDVYILTAIRTNN